MAQIHHNTSILLPNIYHQDSHYAIQYRKQREVCWNLWYNFNQNYATKYSKQISGTDTAENFFQASVTKYDE